VENVSLKADEHTLRLLQRQHLLTVPFENLDIHWNRPIVLDIEKFNAKIVNDKRGGFCYELNGLFNELLREIGFQTRLVSARVFNGSGFTPEYDHAAIIVTIGELEYLADVGFGSFATEPLRFVPDIDQQDPAGVFQIRRGDDGYFVVAKKDGDNWRDEYMFQPLGRHLSEFADRCNFQQYSSDSHFTKGKLISILLDDGRKTLTDKSFIITKNDEKSETPVTSEEDFLRRLKHEFGITQ
jgi:N-hydroxyarylamine O-acetyltransferase